MTIKISLVRVEFYTDETSGPQAVFAFNSIGNCEMDDSILAEVVGWKGNGAGVQSTETCLGSDPGASAQPVLRYLSLPTDVTADAHPISIKITKYGTEGGAILPGTMTFGTK
jgi:hypothetical protein